MFGTEDMPHRPLIRRLVVGLFATCIAIYALMQVGDGEFVAALFWLLAVFAPAVGFVLGARWCRWVVGGCSVLLLLIWSFLVPGAQHEIDRHLVFWAVWVAIEGCLVATVWATLTTPKNKDA
jgi:hypothetical protein